MAVTDPNAPVHLAGKRSREAAIAHDKDAWLANFDAQQKYRLKTAEGETAEAIWSPGMTHWIAIERNPPPCSHGSSGKSCSRSNSRSRNPPDGNIEGRCPAAGHSSPRTAPSFSM